MTAPGMSRWLRVRSVLDRIAAVLLGTAAAPLVAVLGLLVRRHDGGPPFIQVQRVGRGGRPFGMWKIRSMRVEDPAGRALGPALTSSEDDRITPIGRQLRKLHLDELPQLLHVARGEMLLFGPRPEAPEFVDGDDPAWRRVLVAPPGIAGPTQLMVGDWELTQIDRDADGTAYRRIVLPVKLDIDAWYVQGATLRLDLRILGGLVGRVVTGRDARRLRAIVDHDVPTARAALRSA
jgi:lipopolysaccharide/colanic/teichoic acid biosynthesis glycosyltransferase